MDKTKIILSGCNGKMGKAIVSCVEGKENVKIIAGVDITTENNYKFPVYDSFEGITESAHVIIDFSHPSVLDSMLKYACTNKIPCVICTTGYSSIQIEKIKSASDIIPIFYSGNMSLGINLMIELSKIAAKVLSKDFDVEIIEKHHKYKSDAPSGTAISIFNEIKKVRQNTTLQLNRNGNPNRQNEEITIHSVRGGNEIGEHEICFYGNFDTIKLTHKSNAKELFADWGVKGADYISKQKNGLYTEENFFSEIFD